MSKTTLAIALLLPAVLSAQDLVPAGVARVDITPKYPVRLSGYGSRRAESEGTAQPIWAKALAIGHKTDAIVIVTVDNLGIPEEMTAEVARRLKASHGIARDRLAICASHTHSAPMLTPVAPTLFGEPIPPEHQKHIDRYTQELTDDIVRVAAAALDDRKPARLSWAKGKVPFAANRRTPNGPVDHDLPVLKVTDEAGKLRALFVNYACHCTTLGGEFNRIHGDWAGDAQDLLERTNPGALALVAIGCGADANPYPRTGLNLALQHGESIAQEAARLLRGPWTPLPGKIDARLDRVDLDFDKLPTRDQWAALAKQPGAVGYHARVQLQKLDAGRQIPTRLSYPVQTWTFGDKLTMVFLAGEVVVDYALRLKREYDPERLWLNAYANDAPCYIPSLRILKEGGYEGGAAMIYYDRPTRFAPNVEEVIFSALHKQIPEAFKARKDPREFPPPKSPKDSLDCIRLKPGFRAELVAAEPLIASPVAIDWGPDGRLWVVEMYDYPAGVDGKYKPGGRVKYLEDTRGDGVYDKATTLADDLPFPTGIMAWHGGVLVCAAPDILYLEDTKRDGKCDVRRVLFTGFSTENYQARVNGLTHGLDGWVYGANGLLGGKITSKVGRQRTVEIGGRDFRMRPDTGEFEPASGLTQQGRTRDDWGHWFGGDNSNLLRHFPLPDHYLRRNPHFAPPVAFVNVATGDPDPNKVFPASHLLRRFNDFGAAGRVTSACSPTIYRDDLLGQNYRGNSFTCEPVHNLVTRRVLTPKLTTFVGKRSADEQQSEFFASTDNWSRPVQVRTGPDGALWVVDMYRFVIEHPRWITPDRLAELDVRAGADRGRIYRIVPTTVPPRAVPRLNQMTTPQLVQQLDSPNGVVRDLAQRLLLDRMDQAAIGPLKVLARGGNPFGRLHALCTLDGVNALDPATILAALADTHPGVRQHAIRVSERTLADSPAVNAAVAKLADDSDAGVRFQLACSLGYSNHPDAGLALARIARRDAADPYLVAAVLSSVNHDTLPSLVKALVPSGSQQDRADDLLPRVLALAPAFGDKAMLLDLLRTILAPARGVYQSWQLASIASLLDAIDRQSIQLTADRAVADALPPLLRHARELAAGTGDHTQRTLAIRLLGRLPDLLVADIQALARLTSAQQPPPIQSAAVERLAQIQDAAVPGAILSSWNGLSPALRSRVLDILLSRDAWTRAMLDAVAKKQIRPADIDASRRQRLVTHRDEAIRRLAATALQSSLDANRQIVVDSYAKAISNRIGDPKNGALIFAKACAACHRIGEVGNAVGPDLAALTDRSTSYLLISILDPNRALDGRYASFNVLTKRGQQFSGMLIAESGASITLVGPDGKKLDILRSDLEELINTGRSLMPDGLEKDVPPAAMTDLIAFLQLRGKPPKNLPGNKPMMVAAGAGGVFHLRAADCEIHGTDITFEPEFGNLGMWHGQNDHAVWSLEVPRPARYRVEMAYACDNSSAGNTLIVQAGEAKLTIRVAGTGRWADYGAAKIGEMELPGGRLQLSVRPGGPLRGALIDLKEIRLVPVN